jgi:arsenate reductase
MAEAFLKSFDKKLKVYSAGTNPAEKVNPFAIRVMQEKGIDISRNIPQNVNKFLSEEFDYLITVCDGAKETCPVFNGKVKNHLHIGFEDPADATGNDEEILAIFRTTRDKIRDKFLSFYLTEIKFNPGNK